MSSFLFSILAQTEAGTGSDWNWLLIFLIFVVVVAIAMILQTRFSAKEAAELAQETHHHEEESHPEAAAVELAPAALAEPEPETPPQPEPQVVAAPVVPAQPDDLKKIEGIGPKVAGLLNENGISTFVQLAATPVEKLDEILEAAKLQMMNPASWPQQAQLAANGEWEALQKLQDELKGGR
jgi:predicted flap endonuclease-1-like 5' DNA nuclease